MALFRVFALAAAVLAGAFGAAQAAEPQNTLVIQTDTGTIKIGMLPQVAPKHVAQIAKLANAGEYDGVAFHRVIPGFMAQTGDVEFGKAEMDSAAARRMGTGDSDLPDIPAEFSNLPFERGVAGMARTNNPNSANSQFFIMFAPGHFLNGQYTVWGSVIEGMDAVDAIAVGEPPRNPTRMIRVRTEDQF